MTSFDDNDGALAGQHVVVVTKSDSDDECSAPKEVEDQTIATNSLRNADTTLLRVKVSAEKTGEPTISLSPQS